MVASQSTATLDNGDTRPLARVGGLPRVEASGPLGALSELLRDQYAALRRWQRDYGGLFEVRLGPASFIIAADANTAAEMLIDGAQTFTRGGPMYQPMKPMFGEDSMLTSEGAVWRSRRRGAQPHFRQRAIAKIASRIDNMVVEVLGELEPGPRDIYQVSGRMSMAVGVAVLMGLELSRPGFEELAGAVDYTLGRIAVGWVADRLPRWVPVPGRRRFKRELEVIDELLRETIHARLTSGELGDDLLGMLLHMSGDDGLTIENIRNEAYALLVAGYETTGNSIAWGLYELARHPEMFDRVRAEADEVLSAGVPNTPTALPYTRQVFMEALRKYPSGIWLPRNAASEGTLAGYTIPTGSAVLCSPYLVHHDPHAWTEPERFDPERFAEGSDQPRSRHAYMPFGLGQHMCIGQHLGMLEGTLALARVAQRWDLAPIPGREPVMRISTTMSAKGGIWLDLARR
ncbi:Epi-isozizaene 5-monooxygenase/(E)-beta-farnesene synthase [Enhygromyxa salina]|uniref:Epi-isozizaene 5-monooxygenase/(E)-beta-farnesene synthase n=1 Tax=Enhygromyxa salina TaxID=215803 RepID=A0A2S9YK34_9BACT|nr:cytochrome P450 [Enhygromyxa salina]PRQ05450.1 Epi-isozizaene 5-monooxygenase/(E)-beta-farnesene synthase [Enhygromyxa salina]